MKQTDQKIDDIVWHDIPVDRISFYTDPFPPHVQIEFSLFNETTKDYDGWILSFIEILSFQTGDFELTHRSGLEINSFHYNIGEGFHGDLTFIVDGPTHATAFKIHVHCKQVELYPKAS